MLILNRIDCNRTMKSVGSRKHFSERSENLSTSRSTYKRRKPTITAPFNLSKSNRRRKENTNDDDLENLKFKFKARKIPKSNKVPFMVYYSTKSLTSFNNISRKNNNTMI